MGSSEIPHDVGEVIRWWDTGSKPQFLPAGRHFLMGMVWYGSHASLGKQVNHNRFGAKDDAIVALLQAKRAIGQQAVLYLSNAYTSWLALETFSHIIEEHLLYRLDLALYRIPSVAGQHGNWFCRQRGKRIDVHTQDFGRKEGLAS